MFVALWLGAVSVVDGLWLSGVEPPGVCGRESWRSDQVGEMAVVCVVEFECKIFRRRVCVHYLGIENGIVLVSTEVIS